MLYIINAGYSFLDGDGIIKTGGDVIELSDDVAAAHREKVMPVNRSAEESAPAIGDHYVAE